MRIESESTIDEAVECQMRLFERTSVAKSQMRLALILALLMFLAFYFGIPDEQSVKLAFASVASVGFVIVFWVIRKPFVRWQIRRVLVEQRGTDKPVFDEIIFDEEGISYRQLGIEIRMSWAIISKIEEDENYIEISAGKRGLVLISQNDFPTTSEKEEWLQFAKSKMGVSSNPR